MILIYSDFSSDELNESGFSSFSLLFSIEILLFTLLSSIFPSLLPDLLISFLFWFDLFINNFLCFFCLDFLGSFGSLSFFNLRNNWSFLILSRIFNLFIYSSVFIWFNCLLYFLSINFSPNILSNSLALYWGILLFSLNSSFILFNLNTPCFFFVFTSSAGFPLNVFVLWNFLYISFLKLNLISIVFELSATECLIDFFKGKSLFLSFISNVW